MPTVKPFKGVRYNREKIRDLSLVVAPPYDVISPAAQDELYKKSAYNVVRLILNKITPSDNGRDNRYSRAGDHLRSWMDEGLLVRDDSEAFYIYDQRYKRSGRYVDHVGFIGLMGLDMAGENKVLPHENTLVAPKTDRLKLMRETRANLCPIYILHDDSKVTGILKDFCKRYRPIIDVNQDGVRHLVWKVDEQKTINALACRMEGKSVFIADGHHRFEVANMYAKEAARSDLPAKLIESSKYIMVYFVEADEKMLAVLPTHRLIKDLGSLKKSDIIEKLEGSFTIERMPKIDKMIKKLSGLSERHAFGMYLGGGDYFVLKSKDLKASDRSVRDKPEEWKRLDVSILHIFILQRLLGVEDTDDNIEFSKDPVETAKAVDRGKFKAAFFLNPTKVSEVKRIAKIGERMPRKSTYFYPKQLSGLVINKF